MQTLDMTDRPTAHYGHVESVKSRSALGHALQPEPAAEFLRGAERA
jgi:hypothetical protein